MTTCWDRARYRGRRGRVERRSGSSEARAAGRRDREGPNRQHDRGTSFRQMDLHGAERPASRGQPAFARDDERRTRSRTGRRASVPSGLPVYTDEALVSLERLADGSFRAMTTKRTQFARRVVLAVGKSSTPRKLGVSGRGSAPQGSAQAVQPEQISRRADRGRRRREQRCRSRYIALSANNDVLLSYRGSEFHRVSKENLRRLGASRVKVRAGDERHGFRTSDLHDQRHRGTVRPGVCPDRERRAVRFSSLTRDSVRDGLAGPTLGCRPR